ncbi:glycosyltransferase [Vreelandella venusta]|uniref:glycosyltransferase n=1 Tax=Vreelandella venusta TaxID=44935 RepID=UPI004043D3B5
MDDLLRYAQQLASQAPTPIVQPIEGRVAYVVNEGHSASSSTQQLAQVLNQRGLEALCIVRPGWPWDETEGNTRTTPEVDINGVRYLNSTLPSSALGCARTTLEATVEKLINLLRVYRPAVVLAEAAGVGLAAWIAARKLGMTFYCGESESKINYKVQGDFFTFVVNQARYVLTLNSKINKELVKYGVNERRIISLCPGFIKDDLPFDRFEVVLDDVNLQRCKYIKGKEYARGKAGKSTSDVRCRNIKKPQLINKRNVRSEVLKNIYGEKVYATGCEEKSKFCNLAEGDVEWNIACQNYTEIDFLIDLKIEQSNADGLLEKEVLVKLEYIDKKGELLRAPDTIPRSKAVGDYVYVAYKEGYYTRVILPVTRGSVNLRLTIIKWGEAKKVYVSNVAYNTLYKDGVSVVIPSYKGRETLFECLESLALQTLSYKKFEVIVVFNGEDDGSSENIKYFSVCYPELNLVALRSDKVGAGAARNHGVSFAGYKYITYIDDDDFVSQEFLESLLMGCNEECISVSNIEDFNKDVFFASPINKQILDNADKSVSSYAKITSAVTLNACKMIPTRIAKNIKYNVNLKSGEDVDYWTRLLCEFKPKFNCLSSLDRAVYYRRVRGNSVSRQVESFDFNVKQRVEVVVELEKINPSAELQSFVDSKVNAQLGFVNRYLEKNPSEWIEFKELADSLELSSRAFQYVNEKHSRALVISYCFPPYIDTAGIVCAKRIIQRNKPVDVISNTMNGVRERDESLWKLVRPYVGRFQEVQTYPSFSNWKVIEEFCNKALSCAEKYISKYTEIYSRSMWPGSHFAAALLKVKYPKLRWIAEFSDPLRVDIHGKERHVEMSNDWLVKNGFSRKIKEEGFSIDNNARLFYWCEMLPYIFADEFIFTNESQKAYMLNMLSDNKLKNRIERRALVSQHPTLPNKFYKLSDYDYPFDDSKINIGYFGSFYATRGIGDVLSALSSLSDEKKERIRVHVFTPQPENVSISECLVNNVYVNKILPYFDFLSVSKKFDTLIVNDADTKSVKWINPYLPSKLSDYIGSGASIWALYEEGSELSNYGFAERVEYKSTIGNEEQSKLVLNSLVSKKSLSTTFIAAHQV